MIGKGGVVVVTAALLGGAAVSFDSSRAPAQESAHLSDRVDAAPDGSVRFSYAAREGVCGDRGGTKIHVLEEDGYPQCAGGSVTVQLDKRGALIDELDLWVGPERSPSDAPDTDLGPVGSAEAAWYLASLAGRGYGVSDDAAEDAIAAAALADSVEIWPALLEMARDEYLAADAREAAIFWLSQFAGEKATVPLENIARSEADTDVRQAALFGLSQLPDGAGFEALMRVAREDDDPELVQASLFWLGQTQDPRAISLFEEILTRD